MATEMVCSVVEYSFVGSVDHKKSASRTVPVVVMNIPPPDRSVISDQQLTKPTDAATAFRLLRSTLIGRECEREAVAMMRALPVSTPKPKGVGVEIGRKAAKQRIAEEGEAATKDRALKGLGIGELEKQSRVEYAGRDDREMG